MILLLLALSFQLYLVNTLLTILNSSSLHPLKFLPALKCSLDFFTVLLPFPDDSNTHQKLYLPNFPLPFFQSPLHHFLSHVFILSKQNCCKSTTLFSAATFHKSPLANVCNVWCYAISYNRASFHLMVNRNVVKNLALLQLLLILLKTTSTHLVLRR